MDYEAFKEQVISSIEIAAAEEIDAKINVDKTPKMNMIMDRINFVFEDQTLGISMFLNDMYQDYINGVPISDISQKCIQIVREQIPDMGKVNDWVIEQVKIENVVPVLSPRNEEFLNDLPHVEFEDLAVIFRISLGDGISSPVDNNMLKNFNVSVEELKEIAFKNEKFTNNIEWQTVNSLLGIPEWYGHPMIVISNNNKIQGASAILNKQTLIEVAEVYSDDLYILPSSIHECIAVPVSECDVQELCEMVSDINEREVSPEERLSDSVYFFDSKTLTLGLAPNQDSREVKPINLGRDTRLK